MNIVFAALNGNGDVEVIFRTLVEAEAYIADHGGSIATIDLDQLRTGPLNEDGTGR